MGNSYQEETKKEGREGHLLLRKKNPHSPQEFLFPYGWEIYSQQARELEEYDANQTGKGNYLPQLFNSPLNFPHTKQSLRKDIPKIHINQP